MSEEDPFVNDIVRYSPLLYNVLVRISGDSHLSEDLVQEAAQRALDHRDSYTPGTNFKAWYLSIGAHLCYDHLRAQRRRRLHFENPEPIYSSPSPPDHTLIELTYMMITSLPQHQSIVMLLLLKGMSRKDVAMNLGIPQSTVGTRVFRARESLEEMGLVELLSTGQKPR